jgi:hypothetical protein
MKKIIVLAFLLAGPALAGPIDSSRFDTCLSREAASGSYSAGAGDTHIMMLSARSLIFKCPETYLDFIHSCVASGLDDESCRVGAMFGAVSAIEKFKR